MQLKQKEVRHILQAKQINEKLAKALEDNTVTKDKLEDYMGKNGTAMDETNANGVTSKDKLPLGLYLIVETRHQKM